jgi:hypothetical protein
VPTTRSAVVEVDVPAAMTTLDLLGRVDYRDAYQVETVVRGTPEEWMRAFLEGAPRWFTVPWIVGLGAGLLGVHPRVLRRPGHVMGWTVLRDEPEAFVVGLDSPRGLQARLATVTTPGRAVIATEIRLNTAYVRFLWPAIRRGHRHFAPYLLALAERTLAERTPPRDQRRPTQGDAVSRARRPGDGVLRAR